jgi:hypothetical protein
MKYLNSFFTVANILMILLTLVIASSLLHFIYVLNYKTYEKLSELGTLGDTIGGLTSPFINGIAGILVYLSFREQKRANDEQYKTLEYERKRSDLLVSYDRIISLIKDLDNDFKNVPFKYWGLKDGGLYPEWIDTWNLEAMDKFNSKDKIYNEKQYELNRPFLMRLSNNLTAFSFIVDLILKHTSENTEDNSQRILVIKITNLIDYYKYKLLEISKSLEVETKEDLNNEMKLIGLQLKKFENDLMKLHEIESKHFFSQVKKAAQGFNPLGAWRKN